MTLCSPLHVGFETRTWFLRDFGAAKRQWRAFSDPRFPQRGRICAVSPSSCSQLSQRRHTSVDKGRSAFLGTGQLRHYASQAFFCFAVLSLGWSRCASAQTTTGGSGELFREDVAGTRIEPAFSPVPIRLGGLLADVRLSEDIRFETNVLNDGANPRSDMSLALEPLVGVRSNWGRHSLSLNARARLQRYNAVKSENRDTFDLRLAGRLDAEAPSAFSGTLRYSREAEDRGSGGNNLTGVGPSFLHILDAHAGGRTQFGKIGLEVSGEALERRYEELRGVGVTRLDQSFRDMRTITLAPRSVVPITPVTALFFSSKVSRSESIAPRPGARRDATGTSVLAGVRLEGAGLIAAEVGFGWRTHNYDLTRFRDYSGLTWDCTFDWYPTQLLSFRLQAGQDFRNSGLLQVPAILVRSVSLTGYYDIKRNVRLKLSIEDDHERYREIGLTTNTATATVSGEYSFSPRIAARLFLRYRDRASTDASRIAAYDGLTTGFSLTGWL
jgi:hypothetical protein